MINIKKTYLPCVITTLLILSISTISKAEILSGKVIDQESNIPLSGVSIRIVGTTRGTVTKHDGTFTLNIESIPSVVRFSSIGYTTMHDTLRTHIKDNMVYTYRLAPTSALTNEVIVSGNRSEQLYSSTPVKVSVLSDKIFEQTQSVSMLEGLRFQPGLRVENSCQNCGASNGARINGMEGAYTQFLIDSRPIFSALNAVYGLEQLPPGMIDRVEVIRGGGSSLFGANAIAGTVNIITKDPIEDEATFSSSYDFLSSG